ncbi:MAG TPA: hypothetical protein VFP65_18185 [Anaeromyxobacteraceae bacterium]|nr:hypothetical protein [Anaeromyxobacteraceae bacterium]
MREKITIREWVGTTPDVSGPDTSGDFDERPGSALGEMADRPVIA